MAETGRRWAQAALYVALVVAILSAIALPAMAAEPRTLLTIADGPVQVLRGEQKFDATEGLGLADDDIVRTAPSVRVARIEFADGRVLDLGPSTQILLLSERTAQGQEWAGATAVVMQGWAKLAAGAAAGRLVMPRAVVVSEARGAVLVQSAADGAALAFAESRGMTVLPRGAGADVTLREGESWTRDATTTTARVSSRMALVIDVPRALAEQVAAPRRAVRRRRSRSRRRRADRGCRPGAVADCRAQAARGAASAAQATTSQAHAHGQRPCTPADRCQVAERERQPPRGQPGRAGTAAARGRAQRIGRLRRDHAAADDLAEPPSR